MVLWNVSRNEVMLWVKWHKALLALFIPGVTRLDPKVIQTLAHLNILKSIIFIPAHITVINTILERVYPCNVDILNL